MCFLRQRYDLSKLIRRSEKKIKDAGLQAEEERRLADTYKEQVFFYNRQIFHFYKNKF